MAAFKPLSDGILLPTEDPGEDVRYWRQLEFPCSIKKHGPVTHLEFSPVKPYNFVATSSVTVVVHRPSPPYSEVMSLKGFKETAYSGSFRHDGQLIVAGGAHGDVQVFRDKISLRKFTGHKGEVHLTRFTSSNFNIFSGSDDNTVRYWDLATGSELVCFAENVDYVRCGASSLANKDIFATGSYDKSINLFDVRTQTSVLKMDHGSPVENVLIHPTGGLLISAGGNFVKVWDTVAGGRLLANLENHHKTVTSLCYSNNYQRLVSASLDRHVKFYDVIDYKVVHTLEYPSAILSLAITPDDSIVAVGMSDGLMSVQKRREEVDEVKRRKSKSKKQPFYASLVKKALVLDSGDHLCEHKRRQRLEEYDKCLKLFEYGNALDAALKIRFRRKTPETTIAVFRELIRRDALRSSLAGRNDPGVADILKFLSKNYCTREFQETIVDVIKILLDIYGDRMAFMPISRAELEKVKTIIDTTIRADIQKTEIKSSLLAIITASNLNQQREPVEHKATDFVYKATENHQTMDIDNDQ